MGLQKIVTGGQTGVDRAALDAAIRLGMPVGGWCPKGRLAEDGRIDERYPLVETPSSRSEERTRWNVRDSNATLVLGSAPFTDGTVITLAEADRLGRPALVVDPARADIAEVREWLAAHDVRTLNVAGPRESVRPGIYRLAYFFLERLLDA